MPQLPISLVVITLNEEKNIERCIKSAPFVSDVVILDSGSQDKTLEIARQLPGVRVFNEPWLGFGPQKNRAAELARYDWILNLDADEALSPELCAEIEAQFSQMDPTIGYEMPRRSFHLGRWILHGGWFPDFQLRLYHRQQARWSPSAIHERVVAPQSARLKSPLLHWVFDDLADQVQTNNRYSGLQAQSLIEKHTQFRLHKLVIKPAVKFVENYIIKLGFLDGLPGFIIAVGSAYSVFLRWAKLWEARTLPSDQESSK